MLCFPFSFTLRSIFIFLFLCSVTKYLFQTILFNNHIIWIFFRVSEVEFQLHSVVVRNNACYDMNFCEFVDLPYMLSFYPRKIMHSREQPVLCCYKIKCSIDMNYVNSMTLHRFLIFILSVWLKCQLLKKRYLIIVLQSTAPFCTVNICFILPGANYIYYSHISLLNLSLNHYLIPQNCLLAILFIL